MISSVCLNYNAIIRFLLITASIGIALLGLGLGSSHWLAHRSTLIEPSSDPYGLYYRLTVDLTDKQGRPIGIDIVVGCGVRRGGIIGGGTSVDVMTMDAAQYAWAIPDGHALSVRTSPALAATDTCTGATTDNGGVPHDWLPFVIFYDDAADLSHGLAYATQDAYASPLARLKFDGARVAKATAAEYLAFKAHGPANLIPPYLSDALLHSDRPERMRSAADIKPEMAADPKRAWRKSDKLDCRGVMRIPLRADVRSELATLRPAGAPKYWHLDGKMPDTLRSKIPFMGVVNQGGFMRHDTPEWSATRPKVYPQTFNGNLDKLTQETFADGSYHLETRLTSNDLGFMACGRKALSPLMEQVTGHHVQLSDLSKETCFVDGILIGKRGECHIYNPLAFENTDYVLLPTGPVAD